MSGWRFWFVCLVLVGILTGCGSGAVMFAPTPPPPDFSPLRYQHPGGAFALIVPRQWSIYEQNTTTLASTAFSAPGDTEPVLLVSVINLDDPLTDGARFTEVMNQYQSQIRPDLERYQEQDRQAMGDGSWRMTGLRRGSGGIQQQVNTFLQARGSLLGVIEVLLPADTSRWGELQAVVNGFELLEVGALESAPLSTLAYAGSGELTVLHVATWTTPSGIFFITGEVANHGGNMIASVPVKAALRTVDGLIVAEANDITMGHAVAPGGFAPFSLRFGQGQPALTDRFEVKIGEENWVPQPVEVIGREALEWIEESTFTPDGRLIIEGEVTNHGDRPAYRLRAVVTIFDAEQQVVAAWYSDLAEPALAVGASAPFQVTVPEMGGQPVNYIVTVQGLASQ